LRDHKKGNEQEKKDSENIKFNNIKKKNMETAAKITGE
jgi:hypothetical protein